MLDPQLVARIRALPVFAQMPPYMHERLARISKVTRYEAGALVFKQWEVARGFYLVLSGQGQLVQQAADGSRRVLAVVNPGQYFNEAALTQELVEQASFITTQPSIILTISRADYAQMPTTPPKVMAPPAPQAPPPQPAPVQPQQPQRPIQPAPVPTVRPVAQPGQPQPAPQPANASRQPITPNVPARTPAAAPSKDEKQPWLNPGERLLMRTHRHWWHAARAMWLPALIGIGLLVAALFIDVAMLRLVLIGLALVIPGGFIFYLYAEWRNDWLLITDQRVLHVEQNILRFTYATEEVGLASIQSVKAALPPIDPMARLLRYGDIAIRTAGAAGNILMDTVPHPERIKDYIFRQSEIAKRAAGLDPSMQDDDIERDAFGEGNTDPGRAAGPVGFLTMQFTNTRGETVYRRHWSIWLRGVTLPLMIIFGGLFVVLFGQALDFLAGAGPISIIGGVFAILVGMVWFWVADWDWRNDLYIIGDTVVTLLERRPFYLQYNEDQILLASVHNIEAVTAGLFRSLFDYGDVSLLLIGDEAPKVFRDVPSPIQVREELSRRQRVAAELARQEEDARNYEAILERMRGELLAGQGNTAQAAQPPQPQRPPLTASPPNTQRPTLPRRRV